MLKVLSVLSILVFSQLIYSQPFVAPSKAETKEAEATFKYKGQWIHPKIIHEFLPWESDHDLPLIASIDVSAATGTNRYYGKAIENADGAAFKADDETTTDYKWKGRLKNGKHVLILREFGSGTMVGNSLLVVHFENKTGIDGNNKNYPRLILVADRYLVLGDRAEVKIKIEGNRVKGEVECVKTCTSKKIDILVD